MRRGLRRAQNLRSFYKIELLGLLLIKEEKEKCGR
jgi:hypothetical protein